MIKVSELAVSRAGDERRLLEERLHGVRRGDGESARARGMWGSGPAWKHRRIPGSRTPPPADIWTAGSLVFQKADTATRRSGTVPI
jgi:hypothetical protein